MIQTTPCYPVNYLIELVRQQYQRVILSVMKMSLRTTGETVEKVPQQTLG